MPDTIAADVRRVLAPNPGPMTYWGTNTYLVGKDPVLVIDPGPDDPAHLDAILAACGGASVTGILVTHAHLDHSGLAPALAKQTGAPVFAYGAATEGRSEVMNRFAAAGGIGGGEGVDTGFVPDQGLRDGDTVNVGPYTLTALHTPGHFAGHLAFAFEELMFTGDLVMAWSTTLISPPDGDVRDFLRSAGRIRALRAKRFLPGHGPVVEDPLSRLDILIAHRLQREAEVIGALGQPARAEDIAEAIYKGLQPGLLPAATRNTLAHLLDLWDRKLVEPSGGDPVSAQWNRIAK